MPSGPETPARTTAWTAVHAASLAVAIPFLMWVDRDQWFTADSWAVITTRGLGGNEQTLGVFDPHFEHWATVPILVYRALYSAFALRTYAPYLLVLVAVQVAIAHLLWRLLLRVGVRPPFATGLAAVFVVLAVGWENLTNAWQITIIAPVATGFAALLVLPEKGPFGRRDAACSALLVLGLMCSGVGVTMAAVVALASALRRGVRVAVATLAAPAACYLIWLAAVGTEGQRSGVSFGDAVRALPGFVWNGLVAAVEGLTRIGTVGPILVVLLAGWLAIRARPRTEPWPLVLATSGGAVLSLMLTGLRRSGADPGTSRYAYVVVALLLPALALASQELVLVLARRTGRVTLFLAGAVLVALVVVQPLDLNRTVQHAYFVGEMRPRVLGTAMLLRKGEPTISPNIFGIFYLPEPSTSTIAGFDRNGELPGLSELTEADLLTAREYVQLVVGAGKASEEGIAELVGVRRSRVELDGEPGCVRIVPVGRHPDVTLAFPSAATIRLQTERDHNLALSLERAGERGRPRFAFVERGDELPVRVARGGLSLRIGVPSRGATRVCGLSP